MFAKIVLLPLSSSGSFVNTSLLNNIINRHKNKLLPVLLFCQCAYSELI